MQPDHALFAEQLRRGDTLIGTLVGFNNSAVVELLAGCGYDWLFLDAEHGAFLPGECLTLLQAAAPCPCLIRVPAADPVWVKKALDTGASGIIVPQVHDAADAQRMVAAAKYAPAGNRGVGVGRAHAYGPGFGRYLARANDETLVVLQAESRAAIDNIDEITALPGIDAILIGPYDLSASLGHIGDVEHAEVVDAIDTVAGACRHAGIKLGIFGITPEAVRPYMDKGFTLITVGVDSLFLNQAAGAALNALRDKQ